MSTNVNKDRETRMTMTGHAESLRTKHALLETAIEQENNSPHPDENLIRDLKRRKLRIKDELQQIEIAE